MEVKISDLEKSVEKYPELRRGCIIDTNVLFAGSYPSDTYNDWADDVFKTLNRLSIPSYTNLNVRSEFFDLHRRVLIPEGLVDFYDDLSESLDGKIYEKLKYLKRRAKDARDQGRPFKLNDSEIKEYMELLGHEPRPEGVSGWTAFCQAYFAPYITDVWEDAVKDLKVNFLGTREIESKEFFDKHPSWSNMIKILGDSGIGSADAMILNLFQESKLPLLITADKSVRNTVLNSSFIGKFILSP
ncbi:MAG TPA: hypothetical protein VNJ08_05440 [Bacteriovoracaceae bacterium]|nr:hypothetical protein [Bacteriovoracaceae bacterium]